MLLVMHHPCAYSASLGIVPAYAQAFLQRVKLRFPMLEVVVDSMVQYISVWQSLYYYGWAL